MIVCVCDARTRCREAVSEREGQVKKTAGRVTALQSLISQLRRQITLSEERLPQLEEAKKTAVAGEPPMYSHTEN